MMLDPDKRMMALHEEVDDNNGGKAEQEDADHNACRLASVPATAHAAGKKIAEKAPDEEAEKFLGIARED